LILAGILDFGRHKLRRATSDRHDPNLKA